MPEYLLLDFSEVFKNLPVITEEVLRRAEEATGEVCLQLFNDAVMESPTVPKKTGHLRASGSVLVEGKSIFISQEPTTLPGDPVTEDLEFRAPGKITGAVGFNTPYAAHLHETETLHFHEPGSGAKFLEAKIVKYETQYAAHVAEKVKGG